MIQNCPYSLVDLSSVSFFQEGPGLLSSQFAQHGEDGVPFINIRTIGLNGDIDKSKCSILKQTEFEKRYKHFLLDAGDFVVSSSGTLGKLAEIKASDLPLLLNTSVIRFRSLDESKLYKDYLKWFIKSDIFMFQIQAASTGTAIKNFGPSHLNKMVIPLPPLPVQKQIAAVLEKADTLRQQCQQMEQELNTLAQSVFLDMFGDPVANPMGWKKKQLKQLVKDFQGGKSLASSENAEGAGVNRVLKISAVTWGEFKPEESKPLPNDYDPPFEHFVRVSDLLFSRANTTELVGATSLVFQTPENVLLPDKLWRFVWHDPTSISQVFYWQLLSNKAVRVELGKISSGSGGSMKNISKGKLNEFEVLYPPIELQKKFELIYLEIRSQQQLALSKLVALNDTFNSLMQRAFKGELELLICT